MTPQPAATQPPKPKAAKRLTVAANPHLGLFTGNGQEYDIFRPATGEPLPVATFVLRIQEMRGYYLARQEDLPTPARIYGKCYADRIVESYTKRADDGISTGVWLNGEKGAGKTMMAGVLSAKMRDLGLPTVLVQAPYTGAGFNAMIEQLGKCCVIFDEFEKVYNEEPHQNALLTVFAGAVVAKHLYILTTNNSYKVGDAMRNRPSRMRYFIEYKGISPDVVKDYLDDKLVDKASHKAMTGALQQIPECNFDIMQCAVEEHNRFGGTVEDVLGLMNISRRLNSRWNVTFTGTIERGGKKIAGTGTTVWPGDLYSFMDSPDQARDEDGGLVEDVNDLRVHVSFVSKDKRIRTGWNVGCDPTVQTEVAGAKFGTYSFPVTTEDAKGTLTFRQVQQFTHWDQHF